MCPLIPIVGNDSLKPDTAVFRVEEAETSAFPGGTPPSEFLLGVEPTGKLEPSRKEEMIVMGYKDFPVSGVMHRYGYISDCPVTEMVRGAQGGELYDYESHQLMTIASYKGQSGSPVFTTTSTGEDAKLLLGGVVSTVFPQLRLKYYLEEGKEIYQITTSTPEPRFIRRLLRPNSLFKSLDLKVK